MVAFHEPTDEEGGGCWYAPALRGDLRKHFGAYRGVVKFTEHVLQSGERVQVFARRIAVQAPEGIERIAQPLGANAHFVEGVRTRGLVKRVGALAQLPRRRTNQIARYLGRDGLASARAARGTQAQLL